MLYCSWEKKRVLFFLTSWELFMWPKDLVLIVVKMFFAVLGEHAKAFSNSLSLRVYNIPRSHYINGVRISLIKRALVLSLPSTYTHTHTLKIYIYMTVFSLVLLFLSRGFSYPALISSQYTPRWHSSVEESTPRWISTPRFAYVI